MEWLQSSLTWVACRKINPSLLPPTDVKRILRTVITDLENNHRGLDLIFRTVTDVYTKAAVDYHCVNNDVILQISLFTHSYLEEPWQLFKLKSIYVPYSLKPDANLETYTKLKLTKKYIALGAATYMPLECSDLDKCIVLKNKNLCANSFLVQQSADHTCTSVIYFNMAPELVKEACTFETFTDFTPPPEVLETEMEVLLANVQIPWRFNCDCDKFVP